MKNFFSRNNPLYLITDTSIAGLSHLQILKKAISAGVKTVQLRDKDMTKRKLYSEAVMVRKLTLKHKVKFIVNDYIDSAKVTIKPRLLLPLVAFILVSAGFGLCFVYKMLIQFCLVGPSERMFYRLSQHNYRYIHL